MDSASYSMPPFAQRLGPRRSPVPPEPSVHRESYIDPASGSRSASGSSRSLRNQPYEKQLHHIEDSVTDLLVATRTLVETLTGWSREIFSEEQVSDVYVNLGYKFNLACRAFQAIDVDTSDLGPVPDMLRTLLEDALSQDASPENLERFLPPIRDIILKLLHGLKRKQTKLRPSRPARDGRSSSARKENSAAVEAIEASVSQLQQDDHGHQRATSQRRGGAISPDPTGHSSAYAESSYLSNRHAHNHSADSQGTVYSDRDSTRSNRPTMPDNTTSTYPKAPHNSAIYPNVTTTTSRSAMDSRANRERDHPSYQSKAYTAASFAHPPPPIPPSPRQNDAINQLQRSGELERRASRRFSAYQIQKHLGSSPGGPAPMLPGSPSASATGKSSRESVLSRYRGSRHPKAPDLPPKVITEPLHEEDDYSNPTIPARAQPPVLEPYSPPRSSRESTVAPYTPTPTKTSPVVGQDVIEPPAPEKTDAATAPAANKEPEPAPNKELTLFLQYKTKVKKCVLPEGDSDLTIGRLQLAFIEKFAWNTHNNGTDLPEIYIQDPVSGVRHELEDLSDVKDRSVLVLNVEPLEEVRKHFDDSVGGIRKLLEGMKDSVDTQTTSLQHVSEHQKQAANDIARLAAEPPVAQPAARAALPPAKTDALSEIGSLRGDLAVLRQTYSTFTSDVASSMNSVREQAGRIKSVSVDVSMPSYEGDAGRAHIVEGKKHLSTESERLVARVDDLQDLVEELRKDVVTRGVRPLPRRLEAVSRDISAVTKELKKMQTYLKKERPIWSKIWERELQFVCEERDQLTMQEDLAVDLEDDLEKALKTFSLIEEATKQQTMQAASANSGSSGGSSIPLRNASKILGAAAPVAPMDPLKAKDNLMGEVRALQPNSQSRLEAIERAQQVRRQEFGNRDIFKFKRELDSFVVEDKLRKSGGGGDGNGIEQLERARSAKDEQLRKLAWEELNSSLAAQGNSAFGAVAAAAAADGADYTTTTASIPRRDDPAAVKPQQPTDEKTASATTVDTPEEQTPTARTATVTTIMEEEDTEMSTSNAPLDDGPRGKTRTSTNETSEVKHVRKETEAGSADAGEGEAGAEAEDDVEVANEDRNILTEEDKEGLDAVENTATTGGVDEEEKDEQAQRRSEIVREDEAEHESIHETPQRRSTSPKKLASAGLEQ